MPASAVHHTATVNEAWDGPAAVAAMPNSKSVLTYCHAWHAADNGDEKSGYKFPHHKTEGGPANIPGCRNGLARLAGSSIPGGDKPGVRAHLQAHLNDYNRKADAMSSEFWARAVALGNLTNEQRAQQHAPRIQQHSGRTDGGWFSFRNAGADETVLDLQDEIGFWGVLASEFGQQLNQVSTSTITLRVNSPGGDVFDGVAIGNMLRQHPATVNAVVYGLAASAASFICMAADSVTMLPGTQMMIHDAMGGCRGNAADMRELADLLDQISGTIADQYAAKAGGDSETWRAAMRKETWYTPEQAVAAGLADHVGDGNATVAENAVRAKHWNLSAFQSTHSERQPATIAATAGISEQRVSELIAAALAQAKVEAAVEHAQQNKVKAWDTAAFTRAAEGQKR